VTGPFTPDEERQRRRAALRAAGVSAVLGVAFIVAWYQFRFFGLLAVVIIGAVLGESYRSYVRRRRP
jgi:hypothetical protein